VGLFLVPGTSARLTKTGYSIFQVSKFFHTRVLNGAQIP